MSLVRQNEVSREPPHLGDGTLANLVPAVKDFIESTQVLPSSTEGLGPRHTGSFFLTFVASHGSSVQVSRSQRLKYCLEERSII